MNCNNCKAEWTPPKGVSITQCPFCGKPLLELQNSRKNAEPHEILLKIVQQYDRKKLGDTLLKGMLSDLMPHVEKKYQRIFKQALDDKVGSKLLDLENEDESVRIIRISSLKDSFKNNNGFDQTADYVVDCFLFALGWIETVNKEQYNKVGADSLSNIDQQIDMAFVDGILKKEEAKLLFSSAQKFGFTEDEIAEMINEKIKSLKLIAFPKPDKSLKSPKEIICSSDWCSEKETTPTADTFNDKKYKTVKIGNQVWMAENLNVNSYRNGAPILHADTEEKWLKYGSEGKGCWCFYKNKESKGIRYGKLYNWFAVNDIRDLAPNGFKVPSKEDFERLIYNLGGKDAMKEITRMPGFGALLAGTYGSQGMPEDPDDMVFFGEKACAYFWSSSMFGSDNHESLPFALHIGKVFQTDSKYDGYSVRCLKI